MRKEKRWTYSYLYLSFRENKRALMEKIQWHWARNPSSLLPFSLSQHLPHQTRLLKSRDLVSQVTWSTSGLAPFLTLPVSEFSWVSQARKLGGIFQSSFPSTPTIARRHQMISLGALKDAAFLYPWNTCIFCLTYCKLTQVPFPPLGLPALHQSPCLLNKNLFVPLLCLKF